MTSEDRRVRRTKERLRSALVSLIVEKGYDKTTVQDLIDRADVGRSTFYSHYETKNDLLLSTLDGLTADIAQSMAADQAEKEAILPALGVFRHIADKHRHYQALIGSRGIDIVHRAALQTLTDQARAAIDRRPPDPDVAAVPPEVTAAFAAGSLMAFVTWWLDNDMPYPPDKMAEMFYQLTRAA